MWTFMHSKFHFHMSVLGWKLLLRWFFPSSVSISCLFFSHSSSVTSPIVLSPAPHISSPSTSPPSPAHRILSGEEAASLSRSWKDEWEEAGEREEAKCEECFKRMAMRRMEVSDGGLDTYIFGLWGSWGGCGALIWPTHAVEVCFCASGLWERPQDDGAALSFEHPRICHLWLLYTSHCATTCCHCAGMEFSAQEVLLHTRCWVQRRCYRCQIAAVGICSISVTQLHNTNPTSAQDLQTLQIAMTTAAVPTC